MTDIVRMTTLLPPLFAILGALVGGVHLAALAFGIYAKIPNFDAVIHTFAGGWVATGFLWLLTDPRTRRWWGVLTPATVVWCAVTGALTIGVAWETAEYLLHTFAPHFASVVGMVPGMLSDTLSDLLADVMGGVVVGGAFVWKRIPQRGGGKQEASTTRARESVASVVAGREEGVPRPVSIARADRVAPVKRARRPRAAPSATRTV